MEMRCFRRSFKWLRELYRAITGIYIHDIYIRTYMYIIPCRIICRYKYFLIHTYFHTNILSIIAFHDNSSSIRGCMVDTLLPLDPSTSSPLRSQRVMMHPILTAETHNFPTGLYMYTHTYMCVYIHVYVYVYNRSSAIRRGGDRHRRKASGCHGNWTG